MKLCNFCESRDLEIYGEHFYCRTCTTSGKADTLENETVYDAVIQSKSRLATAFVRKMEDGRYFSSLLGKFFKRRMDAVRKTIERLDQEVKE